MAGLRLRRHAPQPGVKVRTLYFAVLLKNGKTWNLEDLQLQSMESGRVPPPARTDVAG